MKSLLTLAFAGLFSLGLMAQTASQSAQSDDQSAKTDKKVAKAEKKEAKAAEKGKDMSLTGWVKSEGGKTTFVNDKDKQSWDIANPDAVKGHEGHHVKVKAKLDESNHSLTVDSVKMMKEKKQSGEKQKADKS